MGLGKGKLYKWSASPKVARRHRKMLQKEAAMIGFGEQNVFGGSDCRGAGAGGGSGSIVGHEGSTMAVVQWPKDVRSVASGGLKWRQY